MPKGADARLPVEPTPFDARLRDPGGEPDHDLESGVNSMLTTKKLSLVTLLAIGAIAPASAFAEHRRDEAATWVQLGQVGTHTHDAEDYVPVNGRQRLDRIA